MKKRPIIFFVLSLVFTGIAVSFPFQIGFLYGHGMTDLDIIFYKITDLNLVIAVLAAVNVALLLQASPYLKAVLPVTLALVFWNNYVVGSYGQDYSMIVTSLASLGLWVICAPIASKSNLFLLNNPQYRWWRTPKRIKTHLKTSLHPHVGNNMLAMTYDLSESGVYIPLSSCKDTKSKQNLYQINLREGDLTTVNISLSQFKSIRCCARVARFSEGSETHPAGMGLQFMDLDQQARRDLRKFVDTI